MYTIHTTPSAQLVSQQKSEGSMKAGHWEDVSTGSSSDDALLLTQPATDRAAVPADPGLKGKRWVQRLYGHETGVGFLLEEDY